MPTIKLHNTCLVSCGESDDPKPLRKVLWTCILIFILLFKFSFCVCVWWWAWSFECRILVHWYTLEPTLSVSILCECVLYSVQRVLQIGVCSQTLTMIMIGYENSRSESKTDILLPVCHCMTSLTSFSLNHLSGEHLACSLPLHFSLSESGLPSGVYDVNFIKYMYILWVPKCLNINKYQQKSPWWVPYWKQHLVANEEGK